MQAFLLVLAVFVVAQAKPDEPPGKGWVKQSNPVCGESCCSAVCKDAIKDSKPFSTKDAICYCKAPVDEPPAKGWIKQSNPVCGKDCCVAVCNGINKNWKSFSTDEAICYCKNPMLRG